MIRQFLIASISLLALTASAQTLTLTRAPKQDDRLYYALVFETNQTDNDILFKAKLEQRITQIGEDGRYVAMMTQTEQVMTIEGKPVEMTTTEMVDFATHAANGRLLSIAGQDSGPDTFRMSALTAFVLPEGPLEPGDSWTVEYNADEEVGSAQAKVTFKYVKQEKVGDVQTALIEIHSKEEQQLGANLTGKIWINVETSFLVKAEYEFQNAPVGNLAVHGKITLNQIEG